MLPETALRSMKIMFATPCYIPAVSMNYVTSIFSLTYACASRGMDCTLHMHSECLITRGRNKMVIKFLEDDSYGKSIMDCISLRCHNRAAFKWR